MEIQKPGIAAGRSSVAEERVDARARRADVLDSRAKSTMRDRERLLPIYEKIQKELYGTGFAVVLLKDYIGIGDFVYPKLEANELSGGYLKSEFGPIRIYFKNANLYRVHSTHRHNGSIWWKGHQKAQILEKGSVTDDLDEAEIFFLLGRLMETMEGLWMHNEKFTRVRSVKQFYKQRNLAIPDTDNLISKYFKHFTLIGFTVFILYYMFL